MVMKFKVLTQNLKRGKWESGIRSQELGEKAKVLTQNSKVEIKKWNWVGREDAKAKYW